VRNYFVYLQCELQSDITLIPRANVAEFFQPCIDCIVQAVLEQKASAHKSEISVSRVSFHDR
jgi:hypothetical protein